LDGLKLKSNFNLEFIPASRFCQKILRPELAIPPFTRARGCLISAPAVMTKRLRCPLMSNPKRTPHERFKRSNIQ
jgi:hypothetical protein